MSHIVIFGLIVYFLKFLTLKKQFLITGTRDFHQLGPAKFRTRADSSTEQIAIITEIKKMQALIHFWQ